METAYKHFITATTKVAYRDLDTNSTVDELNYGRIILKFADGIAYDGYKILENLVDLLFV